MAMSALELYKDKFADTEKSSSPTSVDFLRKPYFKVVAVTLVAEADLSFFCACIQHQRPNVSESLQSLQSCSREHSRGLL